MILNLTVPHGISSIKPVGRGGNEAGIYFYIYYIDCFLVRRSPHRGTLENGSPGGFHECESLENLIHGTFILIAFSIFVISAEIGQGICFLNLVYF